MRTAHTHSQNFTTFHLTSMCIVRHPPVNAVICPFTLPSAYRLFLSNKNGFTHAVYCLFLSSNVFLRVGHLVGTSVQVNSIHFSLISVSLIHSHTLLPGFRLSGRSFSFSATSLRGDRYTAEGGWGGMEINKALNTKCGSTPVSCLSALSSFI